ncbi:MAG TPA: Hsp70 family protein, partial [bacterium]|nr:Hsp70 family protein [bacterium]
NVTAKDTATNREQSIKITGTSTLSKEAVDKMVLEAEKFATEDKSKREAAEARNRGDTLAYQVEKLLKDHSDKISPDERKKVEDALNELREALKGDDVGRISRATEAVQQASYKLSEEMYKATAGAPAGAAAGTPGPGPGQGAQGSKPGDDVIDAEYKPSQ